MPRVPAFRQNQPNRHGILHTLRFLRASRNRHASHDEFISKPYTDRIGVRHFGLLVKNTNKGGTHATPRVGVPTDMPRVPAFGRNQPNRHGILHTLRFLRASRNRHASHDEFISKPYTDRIGVRHFGLLVKNTNKGGTHATPRVGVPTDMPRVPAFRRKPPNRHGILQALRFLRASRNRHASHDEFISKPYTDRIRVRHFGLLVKNTNKGGKGGIAFFTFIAVGFNRRIKELPK
jgi:hypothetical protein